MPIPATKTLEAIDSAINEDQGGRFRELLRGLIPKMEDAYRKDSSPFRTHLGASLIGGACSRSLWYGFRWAVKATFKSRILRLFNRGHLEEARFLAMLQLIGCNVFYETDDGGQFKFNYFGGHYGSSLDGVVSNIPDLPGKNCYAEFKTHSEKSFKELVRKGVHEAHQKHYTQMQQCMAAFNLEWSLYMAVNKNNDELYAELIPYDQVNAERYLKRAEKIIFDHKIPDRINDNPSWFECKFCDKRELCHSKVTPEINCRTCDHSKPTKNGEWVCSKTGTDLTKEEQLKGCDKHLFNPQMLSGAKLIDVSQNDAIVIEWLNETITYGPDHLTSDELSKKAEEHGKPI